MVKVCHSQQIKQFVAYVAGLTYLEFCPFPVLMMTDQLWLYIIHIFKKQSSHFLLTYGFLNLEASKFPFPSTKTQYLI